jgi:hypothetical protein
MARWNYTLHLKDFFHDETLTFPEWRDRVVNRVRSTTWYKATSTAGDPCLADIVGELADTQDRREFDQVFAAVYDQADYDRCWIETR